MTTISGSGPCARDLYDWSEEEMEVIFKSPTVSDVSSAQNLLFGENHTRQFARWDHSAIIDKIVTPGSLLLVEGFSALIEVTRCDREQIFSTLEISEYAKPMLTVMGWDRLNHMSSVRDKVFTCDYDASSHRSCIFGDDESFSPMGEKLAFFSEVSRGSYPDDIRPMVNDSLDQISQSLSEQIVAGFPNRTAAMVHTLNEIEQRRQSGETMGKVFLIAGSDHLIDQSARDPRYSLTSLYETLNKISSIVMVSKRLNKPRTFEEL